MPIFEGAFWKYVWPLLWTGSTGVGIKLYIKDGDGLDSDFINNSTPTKPIAVVTNSYKKALEDQQLKPITSSTTDDKVQIIMQSRIFPHHTHKITYSANQLFTGNPKVDMDVKEYKDKSEKKVFVFVKNKDSDIQAYKNACITALGLEKFTTGDQKSTSDAQFIKLRAWCAESKIKDVLSRHKLLPLKTDNSDDDETWKEIIAGGWFVPSYKDQQSFITDSELTTFLGTQTSGITDKTSVTDTQVTTLKNKCKTVLDKDFSRTTFPAPTAFIKNIKDADKSAFTNMDEFQEAALFCTKPMSASDFVDKAMHGETRTSLDTTRSDDFCYMSSKTIEEYKAVKTYQPFDGKSFWCAVKELYWKNKTTK